MARRAKRKRKDRPRTRGRNKKVVTAAIPPSSVEKMFAKLGLEVKVDHAELTLGKTLAEELEEK